MRTDVVNIDGQGIWRMEVTVTDVAAIVRLYDVAGDLVTEQTSMLDTRPPEHWLTPERVDALDVTVRTLQAIDEMDWSGRRPLAAYLARTSLVKLEATGLTVE